MSRSSHYLSIALISLCVIQQACYSPVEFTRISTRPALHAVGAADKAAIRTADSTYIIEKEKILPQSWVHGDTLYWMCGQDHDVSTMHKLPVSTIQSFSTDTDIRVSLTDGSEYAMRERQWKIYCRCGKIESIELLESSMYPQLRSGENSVIQQGNIQKLEFGAASAARKSILLGFGILGGCLLLSSLAMSSLSFFPSGQIP